MVDQKGIAYSTDTAKSVTVPTSTGYIQILKDHQNLVSVVTQGVIKIEGELETEEILISSGLLQVKDNAIRIIADYADVASKIVKEEIKSAIERAEKKISGGVFEPTELIQLEKQLKYLRFKEKRANF